jgi:hypothetical protein
MKNATVWNSEYFYGNKISEYGLKNGYVDYRTLAKSFDMVLNNDIIQKTADIGYWETVNGSEMYYIDNTTGDYIDYDDITDWDNVYENYAEIYQYYIISEPGYRILSELTDEIVFYNEILDMYIWGVTHWGTSWDYVLTDIPVKLEKE